MEELQGNSKSLFSPLPQGTGPVPGIELRLRTQQRPNTRFGMLDPVFNTTVALGVRRDAVCMMQISGMGPGIQMLVAELSPSVGMKPTDCQP